MLTTPCMMNRRAMPRWLKNERVCGKREGERRENNTGNAVFHTSYLNLIPEILKLQANLTPAAWGLVPARRASEYPTAAAASLRAVICRTQPSLNNMIMGLRKGELALTGPTGCGKLPYYRNKFNLAKQARLRCGAPLRSETPCFWKDDVTVYSINLKTLWRWSGVSCGRFRGLPLKFMNFTQEQTCPSVRG